jgi:MATE family, multidrug efflux pump
VSGEAAGAPESNLPACRIDRHGRRRVDYRVIVSLALPLVANSAIQAVLSLTDTWFIGRISAEDIAAVGSVYWLVLVVILLFGGIGLAVQTLVAQAYGARRFHRAGEATWTALWGCLLVAPAFGAAALCGRQMLAPFDLDPTIVARALAYWPPRIGLAWLGVAVWSVLGFFNGIGRTRITLIVTAGMAILNAALDQLLIFEFGWGIAGAAWATNLAILAGLAASVAIFLGPWMSRTYASRTTWRPQWRRLTAQVRLGFPMGLLAAADLFGFALFQLMMVHLSAVDGAATQIVIMLTSIAYFPGVGIAMVGTTLVGQAIGAGDRAWARRVGNAIVGACTAYMGLTGLALGLASPWLVRMFVGSDDPLAVEVVALGTVILWIAAAYQLFDGMNLGSSFCLRGAGDAFVPAAMVIVLSWFLFVPAAYTLTFAPGQGWLDGVPHLGFGSPGGWFAADIYIALLGLSMWWRWRSPAWERLTLS